jgi:hypothetical protein
MKKIILAALTIFSLIGTANANVITSTVDISVANSVQYFNFSVTTAGLFDIAAEGSATLGAGYDADPYIYLFSDSLDVANVLASNDDGGVGFNSLISDLLLGFGDYILAISEFSFSAASAISGNNALNINTPGLIQVTLSSQSGVATSTSVPEPATLALFGLGLLGFAVSRRRKQV